MERTSAQPLDHGASTRSSHAPSRPRTHRKAVRVNVATERASNARHRATQSAIAALLAKVETIPEQANWRDNAACAGADLDDFYACTSYRGDAADRATERAKAYCARCPAREQCLLMALRTRDKAAVLGGLTPDERLKAAPKTSVRV